jgi:plasmid maintenance system antidote protein VapI
MPRPKKPDTFKKAFGAVLEKTLQDRQMRQTDLATALQVSPSLINRAMYGTRTATPELVDAIGTSMGLSQQDLTLMHTAAAQDAGYKIPALDLTIPLSPKKEKG